MHEIEGSLLNEIVKFALCLLLEKDWGIFFKFKDSVDDSLVSSQIYKFDCNRCNSIYVGKTTTHLAVYIIEHIGISYRTLLLSSLPPFSVIREHVNISDHENYFNTPEKP